MLELSTIRETVIQVANAITAAIGIESEIVDAHLKIIGGTGRYIKKIGSYEEDGNLDSPYIYSEILRSGREYVCMDVTGDKAYSPLEEELAEIACPIQVEAQVIGIIGLVAFTKEQQSKMEENHESLLNFLRRMSELIASKLIESQSSSKLAVLLESMPEGLLAVDLEGVIFACNFTSETLLRKKRQQLMGTSICDLFSSKELHPGLLKEYREKELIYEDGKKKRRLMFTIVPIPEIGTMLLFQDFEDVAVNAGNIANIQNQTTFDDIFGVSREMRKVKERALQVAESNSTVLITGESGTGKELFARAIHAQSSRRENVFIAINCAAIPDALLESELFGYEKGAFTGADKNGRPGKFELANHGTLFLDEIGDMPLHMQVKLLRALQSRVIERIGGSTPLEIDVRIVAATNKNLEEMIERNEFREDLYFRLNVIPLHIPPLRDRPEDIEPMLRNSLNRFNRIIGKQITGFDEEAVEALKGYHWPGNVRELENAVEYAVNMEQGHKIQLSNLPDRIRSKKNERLIEPKATLKEQTERAQRLIIMECLKTTGMSREGKQRAAAVLGISESSLYRKMKELGIESDQSVRC
ncbi:sigma 54-interacting transcriptional regulator [Anaerovorax odorimutans]|uniref:Sigma 54-interacting transcriptional regulator n=1 Tax=Anaerovorax odorimutans TaxID=109327 RepID=A0ABT1RMJ2_9FIRM|nr:sigma 54-interacting transcriptional regulator [Anaerovorax odorimutans]MCQ4636411.1 sigma 54-interacting transcriptional regulator [Anaerovorax odorimutans]